MVRREVGNKPTSSRLPNISAAVLPLIYVHSRRGQRIPGISVAVLSLNHVISSQTEVVKFWNFLEFVLKNGKFFQPGSEVVNIWIFLEFVLKNGLVHFFPFIMILEPTTTDQPTIFSVLAQLTLRITD